MTNLGRALTMVGKFIAVCKMSGWSARPEYLLHIAAGLRGAGMEENVRYKFAYAWAVDCGGTGPLEYAS